MDGGGDVERPISQCPNCSAEVADEYCPLCGQRRIRPEELSGRRFLHELVDEITSFRSKFKTLDTLRGLLIPGWLAAEYLAGRRQPYLSPFKVYLVCAAMFFFSAPMAGFTLASMLQSDQSGVLEALVSARAAERGLDIPQVNARFDARVQSVFTITLGAVALVFAAMLQLLFRTQHSPYGAHLMFALHFVALSYLVTILAGLGRRLGLSVDVTAAAGYVLIVPYLGVALKRVYRESIVAVLLKTTVLFLLTAVLNNVANMAAIRITLALL